MNRTHLLVLPIVLFCISPDMACAVILVDNLSVETGIASFGEQAPAYWAQSFVAESHSLQGVTVLLASTSGPDDTDFRLLITETGGGTGNGIVPTNVLFESATLTVLFDSTFPFNQLVFNEISVELGNLAIVQGATYAVVLDAFVAFDGVGGAAGGALNSNYADGHFFYYGGASPSGDRSSHFADSEFWIDEQPPQRVEDRDLAFRLVFANVPEPSSLALWDMLGMIGLVKSRFRRPKSN